MERKQFRHEEYLPYYYFSGMSITSSKIHIIMCNDHSFFPYWHSSKYKGRQKLNIVTDPNKIVKAIKNYLKQL